MADNTVSRQIGQLLILSLSAHGGATVHGGAIGLVQNTAAKILADRNALIAAEALYGQRKADKVAATAARRDAEDNARSWIAAMIQWMKSFFGLTWSSAWEALGFSGGSIAIPADPVPTLETASAYFLTHPQHELNDPNAPIAINDTTAAAQQAAVVAARGNSADSNVLLGQAKQARDAALKALYKRMVGLRAELEQLLADDDPRWYAFGFNRPADPEQPETPDNLVLTGLDPGIVFANWDDARRARWYRVFKQVVGVDPEPVEALTQIEESEALVQGLPSGATVKIHIVAYNAAGDSAPSATQQIVVP